MISMRSIVLVTARRVACCAATFMLAAGLLQAQPVRNVVPMYGVGEDEFLLSGYIATRPDGPIDELWNFARAMGITTLEPSLTQEQFDTLIASPLRDSVTGRLIVRGLAPMQQAGVGRELQFYPFDSVQSPFYQWLFVHRAGGRSAYNAAQGGVQERIYSVADSTTPGEMVAWNVAYDWHPWQTNRFAARPYDTTAQDAAAFLSWYQYRGAANRNAPTFHIAVRARLLDAGTARASDSLLRLEVWYEVQKGSAYIDTANVRSVATENMELPYATLYVREGDLARTVGRGAGAYAEVSLPVNLQQAGGRYFGPLHQGNDSRRFDLRLYWTGAAPVAVRSIALRDSIGELVLGDEPASAEYRAAIVGAARRMLYGPAPNGDLRRAVIRLMSGIEPHPTEFATSAAIGRLLNDGLHRGFAAGTAIPVHNEGGTSDRGLQNFHYLVPGDAIFTEMLLAPPVDTSSVYGDDLYKAYRDRFHIDVVQVPSLAEHNGGRFQIPLLRATREAIENDYERVLQIVRMGQYYPFTPAWPWSLGNVTRLGEGARVSDATGRRMIATLFTTAELHLRVRGRTRPLDTLLSHVVEASEMRTMANLALCYGARGIHYYWLGNYTNYLYRSPENPDLWVGVNDSWGSNGPLTRDTTLDHADTFALTDNVATPRYPQGTPRVLIPNFYVGYGVRTREIKRLDAWLPRIGAEMARLRWRDAYSIHACVAHPHIDGRQVPLRPLPAGEIVREVRAASRDGRVDAPSATYVELGLFKTVAGLGADGATDSLRTVDHIFVVNRRSFERPDDVPASSPEGGRLDSLAESRRITIRFGLGREGWRRGIIRVRELAADTARLPLAGAPRMPLDTFIHADSSVNLWLRPGGGALLEITYPLADLRSENAEPGSHGWFAGGPAPLSADPPAATRLRHDVRARDGQGEP
ncbi:MAG: hypothetical protein JST22_19040 [Bacteroidetes bacterium]|nr:hypothetical protein [Bacteroidota bacterium]